MRADSQGGPVGPAGDWGSRIGSVQRRLLDWYAGAHRALPWRDTRDPYAILVSEVMLQQTQVERVVPKYREFLKRFPSLAALAAATRAEVIRAWAPLGYNRRAVRLHELAGRVVADHGGVLPGESARLAGLAGLGPYTSAAVACFAFDEQVATVDTNVRRVLRRVFAERYEVGEPSARDLLTLAAEVLPIGRAAGWNQALMDLGATICTARRPACERCPLADLCTTRPRLEQPLARAAHLAAEGRAVYRAEPPFSGSSRFFRGRTVARLGELVAGESIGLDELGRAIKADFGAADREWLLGLLRGLANDGLARIESEAGGGGEARFSLP